MSTVNYALAISSTDARLRKQLLKAASFVTDVDSTSLNNIQLLPGQIHVIEPKQLLALSVNNIPIQLIMTINGETTTLNISSCLLIPFSSQDVVSITISNHVDNPITLAAKIVFLTV